MKHSLNSALRGYGKSFAHRPLGYATIGVPMTFCSLALMAILSAGCQKETAGAAAGEVQALSSRVAAVEGNVVNDYTGLDRKTSWELQQARAASAKYRNIENAIKDGYADIMVDVENMGHHFMKSAIVDGKFDYSQPEILVYNKNEDGSQELVAVEYAVPIDLPRPEGFTGNKDVWDDKSGFPLWLLHAWVWAYNPDGVFNPTNPTVHLH